VGLFDEGLASNDKDIVLVPRNMNSGNVAAVREFLVGLQLNSDPFLLINDVTFNRVEALGFTMLE
jgi:hypothetical protein